MLRKILLCFILIGFTIILNAQAPSWQWAKNANIKFFDRGSSVCADASGNSYVTGYFLGDTLQLGSIMLFNASSGSSNYDIFLAKVDPSGNFLWAKSIGGTGEEVSTGITLDQTGNCLVVGNFGSTSITIGSTTLTNGGGSDCFVAKYDASGNPVWAKSMKGHAFDEGRSIVTDSNNDVIVTGFYTSDSLNVEATTLHNQGASFNTIDIFLAKYSSTGTLTWVKSFGGTDPDEAYAVTVDNSDNIFFTGDFKSGVCFMDTISIGNLGGPDFFISKCNSSGHVLWVKTAGSNLTNTVKGNSIATDAAGNVFAVGTFENVYLGFDNDTVYNANATGTVPDVFLVKYSGSGNHLWASSANGDVSEYGNSIAVDDAGNSYITGSFSSDTIHFGSTYLVNTLGSEDMYIAQYDASGNLVYAINGDGDGQDQGIGITMNPAGEIFVTGFYAGTYLTLGSTTLNTNTNYWAFFIAKLGAVMSIDEISSAGNIQTYPNPSTGIFTIASESNISTVEIISIVGMNIASIRVENTKTSIDLTGKPKGVYFYRVYNENKIIGTGKLILE